MLDHTDYARSIQQGKTMAVVFNSTEERLYWLRNMLDWFMMFRVTYNPAQEILKFPMFGSSIELFTIRSADDLYILRGRVFDVADFDNTSTPLSTIQTVMAQVRPGNVPQRGYMA